MHAWKHHYQVAEKLLADVEYVYQRQGMSLSERDRVTLELARTHAALAAVRVDPGTVAAMNAEVESRLAALRFHLAA